MTGSRRRGSAERAARRVELLDAADKVISVAGPQASMRAIAAAAGVTKPILYRYFGDKGGLYGALADRYLGPLIGAVRSALVGIQDPNQRVRATVNAYLLFIAEHPQIYRFLIHRAFVEQPAAQTAVSAAIRRLGSEVAAVLREELDVPDDASDAAEALGHGIVGMVHVAGDWWLESQALTREELVDHLTAMLTGGLDSLGDHLRRPMTSSV